MADWKTPRRSAVCCGTERPFGEGERIYSVLRVTEEGLVREDYSEDFFHRREEGPEGEIVWWRTVHREGKKRGLALDFDAIERLFDALEGRESTRLGELRYVVCLLLLRKRRLKMVRVRRAAGGEAMVVRRPRRTAEHEVAVFDLTPERAGELRHDLQALFEGAETGEGEDALPDLGALEARPEEAEPGGALEEGPGEPPPAEDDGDGDGDGDAEGDAARERSGAELGEDTAGRR